jgi:DnaK suppressor protein
MEVAMKQYEEIRRQLEHKREELERRLEKIKDDIRRTEKPLERDFAEQAVERQSDEVLDALGNAARIELAKIRVALTRIERDEYGICVVCGNPIPVKRLEILPDTDRCVVCAEKGDLAG